MPENSSQPRCVRQPGVAPEPRSFGADDIEGIRTSPEDQVRRFDDSGGARETEADRLPPGARPAPPSPGSALRP